MNKRPLSVTIIGWAYIVMGAIGFAYHFAEFKARHPLQPEIAWVELLRLIAIVCGVYMLRRHNWARWLALPWIAYHVDPERLSHTVRVGNSQCALRSPGLLSFPPHGDPLLSGCRNIGDLGT